MRSELLSLGVTFVRGHVQTGRSEKSHSTSLRKFGSRHGAATVQSGLHIFPYGARPARIRHTGADTQRPSAPVWRILAGLAP